MEKSARYLGDGILKADAFINHQLLPGLTKRMGQTFKKEFNLAGVSGTTKIITAEVSGIAPALATAQAFDVPMVFARKKKPAFMTGSLFSAESVSRTKKEDVTLYISGDYLTADDRVIIIDDFLATASTLMALVSIVRKSGAQLMGIGCIIEKIFEKGRSKLTSLGIPVISLAKIDISESKNSFSII